MTTITLLPDTACSYPTTVGAEVASAVGTTPRAIAVFRNTSDVLNLRATLNSITFNAHSPSAETLVTFQLVANPVITGGTWVDLDNCELDINKTATFTGGVVASTEYAFVTPGHGNVKQQASYTKIQAADAGLDLYKNNTFAIVAFTKTTLSTIDIAWSVSWIEKD